MASNSAKNEENFKLFNDQDNVPEINVVKITVTLKSCATTEKELFERTRLVIANSFALINEHTALAYYRLN